jgi:uncharacterized RDD family membrane protein YckC
MPCLDARVLLAWAIVTMPLTNPEAPAFHETVETPEQVRLHLELAGLGTRSIAYILDTLLRYGVLLAIFVTVVLVFDIFQVHWETTSNQFGTHLILIVLPLFYFFMVWGYFAMFEWLWTGQTPGKRAARIRVLKDGGGPISFLDAALRNLVRIVDTSGPMAAIGMLFIFFNKKNKRPGDLLARTIVVREHPKTLTQLLAVSNLPPRVPEDPFADLIRRISLTSDQHDLIARYLQRRDQLDIATRRRLCRQIVDAILNPVRSQPNSEHLNLPQETDNERFLQGLIAAQAGPPPPSRS